MGLQVDMSLPMPSIGQNNKICSESFVWLRMDHSHITDPAAVATFLSDLLPNLKVRHSMGLGGVTGWDSIDDLSFVGMHKRWEEFDRVHEVARQGRSDATSGIWSGCSCLPIQP